MDTFTVIIGSAYRDGSEWNYIVEAVSAEEACGLAKRICEGHREGETFSALYCFKGVVEFCPTLFDGSYKEKPYVPPVIDLRLPRVTVINVPGRIATIQASRVTARRIQKRLTDFSYITKLERTQNGSTLDIHVPDHVSNQDMAQTIADIYGENDCPSSLVSKKMPVTIHVPGSPDVHL